MGARHQAAIGITVGWLGVVSTFTSVYLFAFLRVNFGPNVASTARTLSDDALQVENRGVEFSLIVSTVDDREGLGADDAANAADVDACGVEHAHVPGQHLELATLTEACCAPAAIAFRRWKEFTSAHQGLFLWEVFVTEAARSDSHEGDARVAVDAFVNPSSGAIAPRREEVVSLIGPSARSEWMEQRPGMVASALPGGTSGSAQ